MQRLAVALQPRPQLGEHPCALLNARALGDKLTSELFVRRAVPNENIPGVINAAGEKLVELGGSFGERRADCFGSVFIVALFRPVIARAEGAAFHHKFPVAAARPCIGHAKASHRPPRKDTVWPQMRPAFCARGAYHRLLTCVDIFGLFNLLRAVRLLRSEKRCRG